MCEREREKERPLSRRVDLRRLPLFRALDGVRGGGVSKNMAGEVVVSEKSDARGSGREGCKRKRVRVRERKRESLGASCS